MIFDVETAPVLINMLKEEIRAPYIHSYLSTLGGKERAAIMLTVSLDEKSTWINHIMQNSRYFHMSIERDGTMDQFTRSGIDLKLRKTKAISMQDVIDKINKYIEKVE